MRCEVSVFFLLSQSNKEEPVPKTIQQSVTFKATPHDVYEALMDSAKHANFTGADARVSREAGEKFTAYDGAIEGTNVELAPDAEIIQSWRCDAPGWPKNHFSHLRIALEPVDGGTQLTLNHDDVPDPSYEECSAGWRTEYWDKMKQTFDW